MHGVGIGDLNLWQTGQSRSAMITVDDVTIHVMSIPFVDWQSKASKLFRMQLIQNNVLPVLLQLREFLSGHLLLLDDGSTGGMTKSLENYTMNIWE